MNEPSATRAWALAGMGLAALLVAIAAWWLDRDRPDSHAAGSIATERTETHARTNVGGSPPTSAGPGASAVAGALGDAVVSGMIVDPESGPLSLGRVELWCEDGQVGARVPVDEVGQFVGPACAETTCARLVHPAYWQTDAWVLEPGTPRELTVSPAPGVVGRVLSPEGRPVADASLLLHDDSGRRATARTDVDGEFGLSLTRPHRCDPCAGTSDCPAREPDTQPADLLAWASGFGPVEIAIALGAETDLELVLAPPAAPITGTLLDRDGLAFDGRATVLAINVERETEQHAARVDASGSFTLDGLADARYRLRAVRDGQELAVVRDVAPGEVVELRTEQSARGVELRVEIRDPRGRPLADVHVDGGPFRGATTDEQGEVRARGVSRGRTTVRVRAPSCPIARESFEIDAGEGEVVRRIVQLSCGVD